MPLAAILRLLHFAIAALGALGSAFAQSGPPPGVVIATTPDAATTFIGSPSIVILPDGDYLASHDWFGPGASIPGETAVYRSTDQGATWTPLARLPHIHFASLFVHRGDVYLLGTSINQSPGYISLRRSTDGGATWSPATAGRLFTATPGAFFSCAPTPVIVSGGRLWRSFTERLENRPSFTGYRALMISAPADAPDLLTAPWTRTDSVPFEPAWLNAARPGWAEGNAVELPGGGVASILRMDTFPGVAHACALTGAAAGIPRYELAALVRSPSPASSVFAPADSASWLALPGAAAKFTLRYDPVSARYWALVNKITYIDEYCTATFARCPQMQRNVFALLSSPDLRTWTEHARVLRWKEGQPMTQTDATGFQYPDFQFDGDDLIYVSRTGWKAHRAHDANYLTFHRIARFRTLTPDRAPPDLSTHTVPPKAP